MPNYYEFEEWCEEFHAREYGYGVKPFFDPLDVHQENNDHLRKELLAKGISPYACQYLGRRGCIIPWEKRPAHCKSFRCPNW